MPASQYTSLSDIVKSEAFGTYVNKDSIEKNPLFQAGLVEADPDFAAAIARNGGTTHQTVLVPNMADLDGDAQDLVDGTAITSDKLETVAEQLPAIGKAKSFAFYDSTTDLTGADPARRIASQFGAYWSRQNKRFILSALKGAFGVSGMSDNILDVSGENNPVLSNDYIQAAFQLLGDNKDILTTILCHSAVALRLKNIGTSEYVQNQKDGEMKIAAYQGKRILEDDHFTADSQGVYPVFILGPGALVMNALPCKKEYEPVREATYSRTSVINRKRYVLGPRGFAYTVPSERAVAANGATNAELENSSNWSLAWEPKSIPLVKLLCKVA